MCGKIGEVHVIMSKLLSKKFSWNKWSTVTHLSDYVVLDLETTGLSAKKEKIIEIGIVKISDGVKIGEFSSLVNPEKQVSSRITKITGITNSDLVEAPLFSEIGVTVKNFIGDSLVIGHNITFDLSFLESAFAECGIHIGYTYLDTLDLARKTFPSFKDHKLETLITQLNLSDGQSHRALDDVYCTHALFEKICDLYSNSPFMDAAFSCCTPIETYYIAPTDHPLSGLSVVLTGTFTFTYSAVQKLISAGGGTVTKNISDDTDYLVYGFQDDLSGNLDAYESMLERASFLQTQGKKIQMINEVGLLKLCGITFY